MTINLTSQIDIFSVSRYTQRVLSMAIFGREVVIFDVANRFVGAPNCNRLEVPSSVSSKAESKNFKLYSVKAR